MANTKTFADMKKPVRRPTPDEIAAFEETGRATARERKVVAKADRKSAKAETRVSANTKTREHGNTEIHKHADTQIRDRTDAETSLSANQDSQEHGNPPSQNPDNTTSRIAVDVKPRQSANTEIRISAPVVRLTIDLPESVHTRFKTACAMTKRKMVDEVRGFIEDRIAELEGEAGRPL